MDWSEQTNQMMKTWTDAQKQLWAGWMQWAQSAAGGGQPTSLFDPSQWMKITADTWSSLREGTTQRLAGNIFGTPDVMMRSVNLIMKAWGMVAPKIEQGRPWQPDLQKMIQQWRDEMVNLPNRAAALQSEFASLTKTVFEQWTPATGPWLSLVSQAITSGHPGAAMMGGTSGLNRLLAFSEAFPMMEGFGEMPRATVVREKVGRIMKAVDAAADLQRAQAEFNVAMAEAMGKAVERTVDHLAKLAEKGETITSVRDLMRTWFSIADRTLNEAFTTPEFLATQDKMITALMTYKVRQRDALELIYDALEIPTRSALDEAYKDIHDLKREVRQLRRELKEVTKSVPAPRGGKKAAKEIEATEAAS